MYLQEKNIDSSGRISSCDGIHLWLLNYAQFSAHDLSPALLTNNEHEQFLAYRAEKDRVHFLTRRTILRRILALYLPIDENDIVLTTGEFGKPFLSQEQNTTDLQFNLSHSQGMFAIALMRQCAIGVDIESTQMDIEYESITALTFSQDETRQLERLPEHLQRRFFYTVWTRKEALVKASGAGLTDEIRAVSTEPDRKKCTISHDGSLFHVATVEVEKHYSLSLAYEIGENHPVEQINVFGVSHLPTLHRPAKTGRRSPAGCAAS